MLCRRLHPDETHSSSTQRQCPLTSAVRWERCCVTVQAVARTSRGGGRSGVSHVATSARRSLLAPLQQRRAVKCRYVSPAAAAAGRWNEMQESSLSWHSSSGKCCVCCVAVLLCWSVGCELLLSVRCQPAPSRSCSLQKQQRGAVEPRVGMWSRASFWQVQRKAKTLRPTSLRLYEARPTRRRPTERSGTTKEFVN